PLALADARITTQGARDVVDSFTHPHGKLPLLQVHGGNLLDGGTGEYWRASDSGSGLLPTRADGGSPTVVSPGVSQPRGHAWDCLVLHDAGAPRGCGRPSRVVLSQVEPCRGASVSVERVPELERA